MKIEDLKIVKVNWIDSSSCERWEFFSSKEQYCINIESIGYLVDETDETITIALNIGMYVDDANQFSCSTCIPKVSIKKLKYLEL